MIADGSDNADAEDFDAAASLVLYNSRRVERTPPSPLSLRISESGWC